MELQYCVPLGIPHSEFKSWSESDQDKALAFNIAKNEICDMCGSREADWVDEETGRLLEKPYLTPVGIRCHGCAQIAQYKESTYKDGTPDGVRIVLWDDEDVDLEGRIKSKHMKRSRADSTD